MVDDVEFMVQAAISCLTLVIYIMVADVEFTVDIG